MGNWNPGNDDGDDVICFIPVLYSMVLDVLPILDMLYCLVDDSGGCESSIGNPWSIVGPWHC